MICSPNEIIHYGSSDKSFYIFSPGLKKHKFYNNKLSFNRIRNVQLSALSPFSLYEITPRCSRSGISTASQGPRPSAMACARPNFGACFDHSGLKWSVMQILPPRYIFAVLPSSSEKNRNIVTRQVHYFKEWGWVPDSTSGADRQTDRTSGRHLSQC